MNKFVFILCIIVFLFKTQTVFSNNLIYDVNNIEVNGKINKNLDKKKLIQSGFQKAFIIFIDKTLLKKDAINLYKTKINTIEDLIFAYQVIKEEKNKNKEDVVIINVKFDPKKISNFLAQNRISYADVSNISLTLLPVLIKKKEIMMFSENFFFNNWLNTKNKKANTNNILINYNLALENIEDLQYINSIKENLELIDIKELSSIKNVKNYAVLLIYFTEDKLRTYIKTSISNKEIDRSIDLKIYLGNEKRTYEEAIVTLKDEITQIWKGQNLIDINTPSFLDLLLDINQINDYLKLSTVLKSIDLIENYSVLEITNKKVKVRLKYKGKLNKIRDTLIENKINIKIVDNIWIARID